MARHIWVQRRDGEEPIYNEAFGSESAVRESWSEPAAKLGLQLIAAVYDRGFHEGIRWAGAKLDQLLEELGRLERHWQSAGLSPDVAKDLHERAGYIRTAVALAKQCSGYVNIV